MKHCLVLLLCLPLVAQTQPSHAAQQKIRDFVQTNQPRILSEFVELLKLENVAHNTPKGHADIQRNAEYIVKMLEKRGVTAKIFNVDGGFPAVYGELLTPGATKTTVFYAHYDGQPVDPSKWKTPPFEPSLVDGRGEKLGPLDQAFYGEATKPQFAWLDDADFRLYARG
ncbi:MAG: hypothetical protein ABIP81_03480, partial [Terriglobales bacterium]